MVASFCIACLNDLVGGYVLTVDMWEWVVQGYATGSLSEDAYSLRHFADQGMQLLCACSFAKNMGLYGTHTSRSRAHPCQPLMHVVGPQRASTEIDGICDPVCFDRRACGGAAHAVPESRRVRAGAGSH